MTNEEFAKVLNKRINDLEETLSIKGAEYTTGKDRLSNFKEAALFNDTTQAQALWGFVTKHIIALKDFIAQDAGGFVIPKSQLNEKIGDIIAYCVLLDAILTEEGKM